MTISKPPPLLTNNSCFSGSEEKRCHFVLSVLSMAYAAPLGSKWKKKVASFRQKKGLIIMLSLPCGPISLHLSQNDPSCPPTLTVSNFHNNPLPAVLQHVHCLHAFNERRCNGQCGLGHLFQPWQLPWLTALRAAG